MAFSQEKLSGKYCSIPIGESDVTCIDFKENNHFEYSIAGCLGISDIGTGIFELKNETLKLIFDKKEQPVLNKVEIIEVKSNSEKVDFKFNIKDENGFELYAQIREKGKNEYIDLYDKVNTIKFSKQKLKVTYEILSIGYESVELELSHNSSKNIEIKMFPVVAKVISEKVFILNLIKRNEKEFKIGPNIWNTYRKIN